MEGKAVSYKGGELLRQPVMALSGRSNVGKSSLLNRLMGAAVARVSQKPGCTRAIWLYESGRGFLWADLPGYGYAAVSQAERQKWRRATRQFLEEVRPFVWVLVDSRLSPQRLDLAWVAQLERLGLSYGVLATKADNLSQAQRAKQARILWAAFPRAVWKHFVSARSGEGIADLHKWIEAYLFSV